MLGQWDDQPSDPAYYIDLWFWSGLVRFWLICIGLIQPNLNSRQSWKQLQEQISSLGNVTFLSLFYVQPETLDTYLSAEDIEALKQSDQEKL